jgi:hypothetical protein
VKPALDTAGRKHPAVLVVELSGPILSEPSRTPLVKFTDSWTVRNIAGMPLLQSPVSRLRQHKLTVLVPGDTDDEACV